MGKIDEIKEDIGWLKVIFGVLVAIDVSLLGWMAQNYEHGNKVIVFATLAIILVLSIGIALVNKKAYQKIRELRDL